MDAKSPFDRVIFVCHDDHGEYSPGVYLHGATGGGPACLDDVRSAARAMRAGEVYDSAAGICGELFSHLGPEVTSGGGLSLFDSPKPDADGDVDWQRYCSWNIDLILINVDRGSAECYVSLGGADSPRKDLVARIDDLEFGG